MNECLNCKTRFKPRDTRNAGKYCSRPCMVEYRRLNRKCRHVQRNGYVATVWDKICINCNVAYEAVRSSSKYCSAGCQLKYEYATGARDPSKTSAAAHAAVRGMKFPNKKKAVLSPEALILKGRRVSAGKTGKQVPLLQGRNHWNWKGGADKLEVWKSPDYQQWRKAVMRRDNYMCVLCGDATGGNLEADHIRPRYLFPELTFELANGRTLCKACHKKTASWGHKVKSLTRADFESAA